MEKYKNIERRAWKARALYVLAMIGGVVFLIIPWYQPAGIIFYFVVIVGAGTVYLMRWMMHHAAFECPECHRYFKPSTGSFIMSLNMGIKKLLSCPVCGKNSWCRAVDAASVTDIYRETPGSTVLQNTHEVRDSYYTIQIGIVLAFYALLWFITITLYHSAPDIIPTHIGISGEPDAWGGRSSLFWIPISGLLVVALHVFVMQYARKRKIKDVLYPLITWLIVKSLLVLAGVQFLMIYLAD